MQYHGTTAGLQISNLDGIEGAGYGVLIILCFYKKSHEQTRYLQVPWRINVGHIQVWNGAEKCKNKQAGKDQYGRLSHV